MISFFVLLTVRVVLTAMVDRRRRRLADCFMHSRPHGPRAHGEAGLWLTGSRAIGQDPIRLVRIGEPGLRW